MRKSRKGITCGYRDIKKWKRITKKAPNSPKLKHAPWT